MKKIIIFVILISYFTSCFANNINKGKIIGNKIIEQKDFNIKNFNKLYVSNSFNIVLTQGDEEKLILETDQNLIQYIEVKVLNNNLIIRMNDNYEYNYTKMNLYLNFKFLENIDISGACEITTKGKNYIKFNDLSIDCSGATKIDLNLECNNLEIDCSGATEINLNGKADKFKIDCSGASEIDAKKLESKYCILDASGASTVTVFAIESLNAETSGASSIIYYGNPKIINIDSSGTSDIEKK